MTATDKQPLTPLQEQLCVALEDGSYTQTTDQLHRADNNTFCCLGVACDLLEVGQWRGDTYVVVRANGYEPSYDGSLPPEVAAAFGFRSNTGDIDRFELENADQYARSLTGMNDDAHFSFVEIADFIRNHPERVFNPEVTP